MAHFRVVIQNTKATPRNFSMKVVTLLCLGVAGADLIVTGQPNVIGEWSGVISWPVVAIHAHLLPNGKVLVWPRDGGNQARVWDPGTDLFTPVPLPTMNLFCSGHAFL